MKILGHGHNGALVFDVFCREIDQGIKALFFAANHFGRTHDSRLYGACAQCIETIGTAANLNHGNVTVWVEAEFLCRDPRGELR